MPRLSVIIPTCDRPVLLADCLHTLAAQSLDSREFEVVIVDDGSEHEPGPALTEIVGCLGARWIRQESAGLNAARNHGIAETNGELIAFLDDDTLVSPGWASSVAAGFDAGADGLGGRVQLQFEGVVPPWLTRRQRSYLAEFDLGDAPRWIERDPVPVGANCAVRRTALERIGGFRDGLDRHGTSLVSNGDTEFFRRLRGTGGRVRYEPCARVLHRVPAERLNRSFFLRRAFAQGVSDVLLERPEEQRPRGVIIAREIWRWGRVAPILAQGVATGTGPMNAVQWMSYCRGRFSALASGSGGRG
jgi:glycosyltransferase involved in cell wall biosynthesis